MKMLYVIYIYDGYMVFLHSMVLHGTIWLKKYVPTGSDCGENSWIVVNVLNSEVGSLQCHQIPRVSSLHQRRRSLQRMRFHHQLVS